MSIKMRQIVEKEIYTKVIDVLLAAGFLLSVDNGDNSGREFEIEGSRDRETVLKAMYLCDEDRLYVSTAQPKLAFGWIYFVYGNDGWDVISDYTINLEKYIGDGTEVQKLVDKYAD